MLGEHREELAVARRGRRLVPKLQVFELRALAALGRIDEVWALLEQEEEEAERLWLALKAAGELLVHGHVDAASQVLDRGIMRGQAWLSTLPPDTTSWDGYGISQLADMLVLRGRVDEARVLLERGDSPFRREYIGTLGVIAGMQGDRQRALEIDQYLAAQPWNSRWMPLVCGTPGLRHPWASLTGQPRSFERRWARAGEPGEVIFDRHFFGGFCGIIRRFRS